MTEANAERANPNQPILRLSGISKAFGAVAALTDINLEVYPGEVVALVGDKLRPTITPAPSNR